MAQRRKVARFAQGSRFVFGTPNGTRLAYTVRCMVEAKVAKGEEVVQRILPVVLAGGSGTRLWPLSREQYPKQFLKLVGERTMMQSTLMLLRGLAHSPPIVVCNHSHRFIVAEQCQELGVDVGAIVVEPASRNTAPALCLAALRTIDDDPILLALPADGHIGAVAAFEDAVQRALPHVGAGRIATFGVEPSRPETNYGYIRIGAAEPGAEGVFNVEAFTEKPSQQRARDYLAAGGYCWNSGMFMVRASVYLQELEAFRPDIHRACVEAVASEQRDLDFHRPGAEFHDCPAESIDYAIMEKTAKALVVPADLQWSDLGSWNALADSQEQDAQGNSVRGDVIAVDTRDCYLSGGDRLIAAVGLDGAVVVETPDAVLVAAKSHAQEVKAVVEELRQRSRSEHLEHTTAYRPWGHAETYNRGDGYLVKRITVRPGESLSLQLHRHRSEHWVVVSGEAFVQRGDETFVVAADESTYIPAGVRHRLTNRGPDLLDVIEVQVGERLSENDIVRFDDRYGRE